MGGSGFFHITHAAEHLHTKAGDLDADIGRPAFGDGGEQIGQALPGGIAGMGAIDGGGVEIDKRAAGFGERAHRHDGAAHVGMFDDAHRSGPGAELGGLHTGAGIIQRMLHRPFGNGDALQAHLHAGVVHHGEHGAHAAAFLAHHPADALIMITETHRAGGRSVDAELVFKADAFQIVAGAVGEELGHQEQADALGAGRAVRRAGQHEVDDILRRVMLAPGDEDLGALDAPAAVRVGFRAGFQRADVAAGGWLGEVHRAGPFTGDELGEVALLQFRAGVGGERLDRALGQHHAQRESHVGGGELFLHGDRDGEGQALAAMRFRHAKARPASLHILAIGLHEAGGQRHHAVVQFCVSLVAALVERREHVGGQLAGFGQDRVHHVRRGVGIGGQCGEARQIGDHVEHETLFGGGGGVGHELVSVFAITPV